MKFGTACRHMAAALRDDKVSAVHTESAPSIELFARMCEAGFLTKDSQEGAVTRGRHYLTGKPYVMQERAYVMGFMALTAVPEFVTRVNATGMIVYTAVIVPDNEPFLPASTDIPMTMVDGKVVTRMSTGLPVAVFKQQMKQAGIDATERSKLAYIVCFDSKWSRKGRNRGGLFGIVLAALSA